MFKNIPAFVFLCLFVSGAFAQEGETWQTQEAVWDIRTIKIFPNADEQYLNQLRVTSFARLDMAKRQGLITDYLILKSVLPYEEGYNLLLITRYPNLAALDATKELRDKWMQLDKDLEKVSPKKQRDEITGKVYPNVREITSQKLMREIKFINK